MTDNPLIELIKDSFQQTNTAGSSVGSLGHQFYEVAKRVEEERKRREALALAQELKYVFDPETDAKIIQLRHCDEKGDLAWMENWCWYSLRQDIQESFVESIDPLLFSGVYFSYQKFLSSLERVFRRLSSSGSVSVTRWGRWHQVFVASIHPVWGTMESPKGNVVLSLSSGPRGLVIERREDDVGR